MSYWRSTSGFEVDFIIDDHTAIEVKAKENLSLNDIKSLRALAEEKKRSKKVLQPPYQKLFTFYGRPG